MEKDIRLIRVAIPPLKNRLFFLRGLVQLMLPHLFFRKIRKYINENIDAVIVSSPPLPLAILGSKIKARYGSKYVLCVQDIFPQNAIDLKVIKNKLLIAFFENMERRAYRYADRLTSHTLTSKKFLEEKKGIAPDRLEFIPNWIDLTLYKTEAETGVYRTKYKLGGKFVFLFPGVLGPSQGLDVIVNAFAGANGIPDDLCLLIVGDGSEKEKLVRIKSEYSLQHIEFKPFVPLEKYPLLVKDADVGLVSLSSLNKTPVVPGKVLGYMASSIPIIAFLNKESDGHAIIKEAGCGYSIASDSSKGQIIDLFLRMYHERDKLAQFGANGFNYISRHYAKDSCLDKLIRLI
jgi:glycosyltransferase involved in cell wall biosynthesis